MLMCCFLSGDTPEFKMKDCNVKLSFYGPNHTIQLLYSNRFKNMFDTFRRNDGTIMSKTPAMSSFRLNKKLYAVCFLFVVLPNMCFYKIVMDKTAVQRALCPSLHQMSVRM